MTATTAGPAAPDVPVTPGRPGRPGGRRLWVAVAVAALVAVALALWLRDDETAFGARLDPTNPGPDGGRAVARVLEDQGVRVEVVRSAAAASEALAGTDVPTTVVVTSTSALAPSTTDRLLTDAADSADSPDSADTPVLLVEPDGRALVRLDPDQTATRTPAAEAPAQCAPSATGAPPPDVFTDALPDDLRVAVDAARTYREPGCFAVEDGVLLTAVAGPGVPAGVEVAAFGAGDALTNDQVLRADNAAVALRLLGARDRLVWYVPDPADARSDEAVTLGSLLPRWLVPSLWLLLAAGAALVLWRGRRLGPLSTEPLPVVVRAVETTISRGRLYRRAGDRTHAAAALRRRTRRSLADRLGTPGHADPVLSAVDTVPSAVDPLTLLVAERSGRPVADVARLLGGPPPETDRALIQLAHDLQHLTREVR